ncbi:MAG TPA: acetyl-CoA acetyltransferase [Dehalococcoidia bacterium]|nr:acetyl-CoA acetyltransferase [Dehalococcoidia bacterium]
MANFRELSKQVAIVGAAESDHFGLAPNVSALQLHAEAIKNALDDAGLQKSDVDGMFNTWQMAAVGDYVGINPRYVDATMVGGCSFMILVEHAMLALVHGLCDVAVISHGESGRSNVSNPRLPILPQSPQGQFEAPYGIMGPPSLFSIPVLRHMHQYGTTKRHLAQVAVNTRAWAIKNPKAMKYAEGPITVEDVFNSRLICYPFNLLDCCLVGDAGGALILTRADRAKDLRRQPVYVLGTGEGTAHSLVSMMEDFATSIAARQAGKRAFEMAGVKHEDIDLAMLYDAFTHTPLFALEDLGFVKPGESGPFVEEMGTGPDGKFPMNTNGGGLSYIHTGMYGMFALVEAVRQLRGECGDRQVKAAKMALAHGPGGMFTAGGTVILGTD